MSTVASALPVVSGALPGTGHAFEFGRDALALLARAGAEAGDVARLQLGAADFFILNRPEYIHSVLVTQQDRFLKPGMQPWRPLLGRGLITSTGALWERERKLLFPSFAPRALHTHLPEMQDLVNRHVSRLETGQVVDTTEFFKGLVIELITRTFFENTEKGVCQPIAEGFGACVDAIYARQSSLDKLGARWEALAHVAPPDHVERLRGICRGMIERKREHGRREDDPLATLLAAQTQPASHVTEALVLDEVMSLLFAGYESTAMALTWTLHVLSVHPGVDERAAGELGSHPATQTPEPAATPYLQAVVKEALRLYPPSPFLQRLSREPFALGDHAFPEGTFVMLSPWVTQRDPRYFERPLQFEPERWSGARERALHPFAYFPFGMGPRHCIGRHAALLELTIILGALLRHFRFTPAGEATPRPVAKVSLQPAEPLLLRVHARQP